MTRTGQSARNQPNGQKAIRAERPVRVLVVDDEPAAIDLACAALKGLDAIVITGATSRREALAAMREQRPSLVMLDLFLPEVDGFSLLDDILRIDPHVDVMLLTGHYSTDCAVEAIQKGAYDYVTKPIQIARLREKVEIWLSQTRRRMRASELEDALVRASEFEGIIGRSPLIMEMCSRIARIAPHCTNVLVTGETGTGKELVARALHRLSPASRGPFAVCNSAAISETLFESELFGHCRGSFTGATQDRKGLVEQAAGGTLFLDEIGEVPLQVQAKLLRLLQNREIQRIGEATSRRVDVRIIAATNRDLRESVRVQKFREDLYYRLSTVEIHVPGLAQRREDLTLLVRHFLRQICQLQGRATLALTRRAEALVNRYGWPGNVRELENALHYCAMVCDEGVIDIDDFPEAVGRDASAHLGDQGGEGPLALEEVEQQHVLRVIERAGGNRLKAAKMLGIGRATLYRIVARCRGGCQPPPDVARGLL